MQLPAGLIMMLLQLLLASFAAAAPDSASAVLHYRPAPSVGRNGNRSATRGDEFARRLPQALIIGAKKAGTRALLSFIRVHPDVQAPGPEVHFFDKNYHRGLEWYRQRMPVSLVSQVTMEKTPGYFVDELAPRRVHAMNPKAKLVLVVRDPVSRALSDYAQATANARRTGRGVRPLENLAFRAVAPAQNATTGSVDVATDWTAIRIGEYAKHLGNWLAVFPRNQILVLSGEQLVRDPGSVLVELQRFLGLEVVVTRRHFYYDRRKGFHCLKKSCRGGRPKCLASNKGRRHPILAPKLLKRLRAFYAPRNRRFYELTGINFGWPEA